jgi:hypothetical protein
MLKSLLFNQHLARCEKTKAPTGSQAGRCFFLYQQRERQSPRVVLTQLGDFATERVKLLNKRIQTGRADDGTTVVVVLV